MSCPTLAKVPAITQDLALKLTPSGVTFLTQQRFKLRYLGNKKSYIDINGNLHLSKAEFMRQQAELQADRPKKRRASGGNQKPNDLSCQDKDTENNSEKPEKKRILYTINKKEVRQRILAYINSQKGKKELYFWTVTFPAGTPDEVCYRALNTWLTSLRKYKMLRDYIRITERQDGKRNPQGEATNTIHYHIAIPHKMPVQRANAMMRGTLKNLAKQGLLPYSPHSRQIKNYNGVDICKNRKTKRVVNFAVKKGARALANYLSKYVTKNDSGFKNLAWHCSRGFSCLFTALTLTVEEFRKFGFGPFVNWVRVFELPFARFRPWLYGPPPDFEQHLYQVNSYIQSQLDGTTNTTTNQ